MKRVVFYLVLLMTMTLSAGGRVAGQQRGPSADPGIITRNFSSVTYLKASNPRADAKLGFGSALMGRALALSRDGNTIAIAAPDESSAATGINGNQKDASAGNAGAVYVFSRNGTGRPWAQQAYIKASNTQAYDGFGFSVALSADGNTLAVGATREDSAARGINGNGADNTADVAGAAYVFVRAKGTWSQQAYVKASNADAGDQFGWSIALSDDGNTMAVGAMTEGSNAKGINGNQADNSATDSGAVYVFTRAATTWSQQAYLKGAQTRAGDLFGFCVDLSSDGHTLAVCAMDEDGISSGVNGDEVVPENVAGRGGAIPGGGVPGGGAPGRGAPGAGGPGRGAPGGGAPGRGPNPAARNGSGCAYLFAREGTTWKQTTYFKQSNNVHGNDGFGQALALSGDGKTLVVNATDEDGLVPGINQEQYVGAQDTDQSNGTVFVFVNVNGTWSQQAYIKASNIRINDVFGLRLAVSHDGNLLVASSMLQSGGGRGPNAKEQDFSAEQSGAVYIFTRAGGTWTQRVYLKAPNADAYDEFGSALSLSGDGNTLAVAAWGEDGGSAGVNGNQGDNSVLDSGAVYVY